MSVCASEPVGTGINRRPTRREMAQRRRERFVDLATETAVLFALFVICGSLAVLPTLWWLF